MNLKVVVVIYNKNFACSNTLKSLMVQNLNSESLLSFNVEISIFDNSISRCLLDEDLIHLSNLYKVKYSHNPENSPLSRIYSKIFSNAALGDYILLLDDDTYLPSDFFGVILNTAILSTSIEDVVFVPKVTVRKKMISPYKSFFVFSKPISENYSGFSNNITAINSGVVVKKSKSLSRFSYPSYATFYGTDSVLFEFLNMNDYDIFVMDVLIDHDLSFHPSSQKNTYMNSLHKVIKFWAAHYRRNKISNICLKIYIFLLSVKLSIKYKEIINLFSFTK